MTHEEYLQLVQGSEVFKALEESFQKRILTAKGEEQARYIQIFTTERNGILAARKELVEKNAETVKDFEVGTKKATRKYLASSEKRERGAETNEAENLLNSI